MALHPKKANKLWVWIALSRVTGRILALAVGSRSAKTLKKLWDKIKHLKLFAVHADDYPAYRQIIPEALLFQTKRLTHNIESLNSRIRHYLARFHRRTFCYSKSKDMVEISLYLLLANTMLC